MIRFHLLAAALLLAAGPVAAQTEAPPPAEATEATGATEPAPPLDLETLPATLLLSLEEMVNIESAIAAGPLARLSGAEDADPARFRLRQNLYVSAILYMGPGDWTVWINGRAISPEAPAEVFEVIDVGPGFVRLAVPWGEGGTRDVMMRAHQTFVPRRGDVLEGQY